MAHEAIPISFDWDHVRFFLAVHREHNLAHATAALGVDATTVSRRLGALESTLGARLFDPTRILARAERMEDEATAVAREVAGDDQRLEGVVRLTRERDALHALHRAARRRRSLTGAARA